MVVMGTVCVDLTSRSTSPQGQQRSPLMVKFTRSEATHRRRTAEHRHRPRKRSEYWPEPLPGRLRSVLSVVYLIYNTGVDHPERSALRVEAVRLGRALVELMSDEPEAAGLLALMLLSD